MKDTVKKFKWLTIADYEDEEVWLREMHKKGLKLKSVKFCVFTFEKCEPEDVIYRLEYDANPIAPDYQQMLNDYGWEYVTCYNNFKYFRKPAAAAANENETELFSDNESRLDMLKKIIRTRYLPFIAVFLTAVIPGMNHSFEGNSRIAILSVYGLLFILYIWVGIHITIKLTKLKLKYKKD